ncbi:2-succinyl-5-enolpyruvyl-6-hydroxy-3-cyclohexene-1-carboxylic-acid synthase [Microlunatus ginsengisoli]|uniref:2-succinyl-5-enolpyruvyl-6-hydroxy-3-cyclohexene-1-carboxylate synthase n=1 Tax=Microlunatus ginsengisoli TaxID=363863 RepID=A0ABP6ZQ61_9ACTN
MSEPALACARTIVGSLIGAGVTDAVLAPGSRSAPLAYVLAAADAAGLLRLHVRIDERTAGFLALGLAKASGRPVPVVTTSGTAAANLHPAVLEADAAGIPLLAITADRPGELRHSGANQTTDQLRLFGPAVRGFAAIDDKWRPGAWRAETERLVTLARGTRTRDPGPVQLNVSLADPLLPSGPAGPDVVRPSPIAGALGAEPVTLAPGPRTVVVAGDASPAAGRAIAAQCARAGVPLIAEPSSNARRGPVALAAGRLALAAGALAAEIERVVVVGRPTLSRPVSALLTRTDVEQIVVAERAGWPDPGRVAPRVLDAVELAPGDRNWLTRWQRADRRLVDDIAALLADHALTGQGLTGPGLAAALVGSIPPETPLVVGSSNPVRDLDLAPIRADLGDVYANRGLAGIDGTISTAVGVALATATPAHALVGDLTFLHDLNGLLIGSSEPRPDLRIVVADDAGGSIFATLEHGRPEHAADHERVFATPTGADLAALVAALGISPITVRTAAELAVAVADPPSGIEVVRAVVDRAGRRALDRAITALAASL